MYKKAIILIVIKIIYFKIKNSKSIITYGKNVQINKFLEKNNAKTLNQMFHLLTNKIKKDFFPK